MSHRYIVFDVETPNSFNDRMSAIGITVVEGGRIADEYYTLVDPETHFDPFNMELTGITPAMVAGAPNFAELWKRIEPTMSSGLLVAHNAPFDMSVLAKCLAAYGIEWHPYAYYACTCQMSKKVLPQAPNHKLNTLSEYLRIELDHHNAASDSRACAQVLLYCLSHGADEDQFLRSYDLYKIRTTRARYCLEPDVTGKQLLALQDCLKNITADGEITEREAKRLHRWLMDNRSLRGNFPFDKAFFTVEQALHDGKLEREELEVMQALFARVAEPSTPECTEETPLTGKNYVLTGEFAYGDRQQVQARLAEMGAVSQNNVTRKTDVLIVGSHGSEAWTVGTQGTKMKRALEMQEKGHPIRILREEEAGL